MGASVAAFNPSSSPRTRREAAPIRGPGSQIVRSPWTPARASLGRG